MYPTSEKWKLYDHFTGAAAKEKKKKILEKADHPVVVSDAIHHAITSPTPKTRYAVANFMGIPAWVICLLVPWIPDRIIDTIF
jgi:lambda repressor-like predicted transcriptional regulator